MTVHFFKYHGTGNDFILVDDREDNIRFSEQQIKKLCDRRFGIGADGLILLKDLPGVDFKMVYFNADGKESSMCGNGGRCITSFSKRIGKIKTQATFSAIDGIHKSFITGESPTVVKLQMGDVHEIESGVEFVYLNTGSPHVVIFTDDVAAVDVIAEGKKIRYGGRFREKGVNVNFVQTSGIGLIVRTYERGVEDETLSCGTGVIASALAAINENILDAKKTVVDIQTLGGKLKVYCEKNGSGFNNIWLEGETVFVFRGEVEV